MKEGEEDGEEETGLTCDKKRSVLFYSIIQLSVASIILISQTCPIVRQSIPL